MARGRGAGGSASVSPAPGRSANPSGTWSCDPPRRPCRRDGLEVAVADRELQVPAHGPENHLGGEAEAPKRSGGGHGGYSRKGEGRSTAPTWACCPAQCNRTICERRHVWDSNNHNNHGQLTVLNNRIGLTCYFSSSKAPAGEQATTAAGQALDPYLL